MFGNIKDALSTLRDYLVLSEKVDQNKQEIARMRADYNKLEAKFERLTDIVHKIPDAILQMVKEEMQKGNEKEAAERKIALLELENKFLQQNRTLPPAKKK